MLGNVYICGMKLAIIGSRTAPFIDMTPYIEGVDCVISGGARGVDTMAADWAKEHGIRVVEFLPDYKRFGKGAPLRRNDEIVKACDAVLAFWDGKSRGTLYTINAAKKAGKPVRICYF